MWLYSIADITSAAAAARGRRGANGRIAQCYCVSASAAQQTPHVSRVVVLLCCCVRRLPAAFAAGVGPHKGCVRTIRNRVTVSTAAPPTAAAGRMRARAYAPNNRRRLPSALCVTPFRCQCRMRCSFCCSLLLLLLPNGVVAKRRRQLESRSARKSFTCAQCSSRVCTHGAPVFVVRRKCVYVCVYVSTC